jgi:hypothetical protein
LSGKTEKRLIEKSLPLKRKLEGVGEEEMKQVATRAVPEGPSAQLT